MARVIPGRVTAQVEGDFVVFLIGTRINKPWKIHQWLPACLAMPRMLRVEASHAERRAWWSRRPAVSAAPPASPQGHLRVGQRASVASVNRGCVALKK